MAKNRQESSGKENLPGKMPETPPPNMGLDQHSWILQAVMEMRGSIGQLTEAVNTLTTHSKEQKTKLDSISHRIYAGAVVLGIIVAALLLVLNKIPWKAVLAVLNSAD